MVLTIFGAIFGILIACIALAIGILITIPFSLWNTYVCMHLWNWFMVPSFNIQPITFFLMWGLIITFHAFKGYNVTKEEESKKLNWDELLIKGLKTSLTSSTAMGIAFLMGYVIHRYFV